MFFTKEEIEKARSIDLLTYLRNYEPEDLVHLYGNVYCTRQHDSLKISNGKWMWWSKGFGGTSALDYLIKVKGKEKLNIERDKKNVNPSLAKTEKSPLSEPDLKQENRSNGLTASLKTKPSVKEKLDKYKDQVTAKKIKGKSENNIAKKIAEHTPSLSKVNGKER